MLQERNRSTLRAPAFEAGHPLVFNHIPRTAGTSLRESLVACLEPDVVYVGFDSYAFGPDLDSVHPQIRPLVAASSSELPPDAGVVSGHITPATTMARYDEVNHMTVLREPRARVLSLWMFNRWHTDFRIRRFGGMLESLRACRAPLADYLDNRLVAGHMDNCITRFLVWPHPLVPDADFIDPGADDDLFAAAVERLDRYGFVGIAEEPAFGDRLSAWLGRPFVMLYAGRPALLPRSLRPDVAAEVAAARDTLRARCRIDERVWRHLVRELMPDEDPAALGECAFADAVRRYESGRVFVTAPREGYLRTAVEHAYNLGVRVRTASHRRDGASGEPVPAERVSLG